MEELFTRFKTILVNLKKSPNRRYTATHLARVKKSSRALFKQILATLVETSEQEQLLYKEIVQRIYNEIVQIVDSKLNVPETNLPSFKILSRVVISFSKLLKQVRMANVQEMIKLTSTLIPHGSVDKLPAVLSALEALKTLITNENRAVTIQVVLSRLEGKARVAVGDNSATIDIIINNLKQKCDKRPQPETLLAKLNASKQTGNINEFAKQIETLTLELESCYLTENVPIEVASKLATRAGVKALTVGVRSPETKIILKAGQFNTLASAGEKAIENELAGNQQNASQMLYANRGNFHARGRGNSNHPRGRGNFRRGYNHGNNFQNNHNRNDGSNYQSDYTRGPQRPFHHRGNGRARGRGMNHSAYYAQSQNAQQNFVQQLPVQVQSSQQFLQQPNTGNIHPLGVTLKQHTP